MGIKIVVQVWLDPAIDSAIRIIYLYLSALLGFILRLFPRGSKMAIGQPKPTLFSQIAFIGKEYIFQ